ncbi:MAG: MFS transporter [Chloroflexi bacterium]|nr:MFS transporter [Chloroflexota bacterium]
MGAPRRSLTRHPDFLRLWAAETISQFGTQVTLLALPLIAAAVLQVSAFEFGLLTAIEFLPFILVSLPAGVWVDRLRRRPILILGDLGRAVALLSIPIAFAFDALTIWQLYAVGFVNGCLTVFFDVAYQSYLPSLVGRDQLVEGNSKLEISRSAAQFVGPGFAGIVIGWAGAAAAVVLDALSFLGSAALVTLIRRPESDPTQAADGTARPAGPGMRREIAEGLRYVAGNRHLRSIAACTASANLFGNIGGAIFILYMVREIGMSAQTIGIVFSIGALGFMAGAVLAHRIVRLMGVGPTIIWGAFLSFPAALLVVIAPRGLEVPFFIASGLLNGFSIPIYNINQVSFRQAITPERMQGRMNATMRFVVWGTIPLGATLGGFLGGAIGLRETIWIGALGSALPFLFVLFSPVRSIRSMPEPADLVGPDAPRGADPA